jgi:hypothetical protein
MAIDRVTTVRVTGVDGSVWDCTPAPDRSWMKLEFRELWVDEGEPTTDWEIGE